MPPIVVVIPSKIAGVTYDDPVTGINRQEIIRNYVRPGSPLRLELDDLIPDHPDAVAVWFDHGGMHYHIGYLNRVQAVRVRKVLERGDEVETIVKDITGGTPDTPTLGVNIAFGLPVTKAELRQLEVENQTHVVLKHSRRKSCLVIAGTVVSIIFVIGVLSSLFGNSEVPADGFTPVPTHTDTPAAAKPTTTTIVAVAQSAAPAEPQAAAPTTEITTETATAVMAMLIAQDVATKGLQQLAASIQSGESDGSYGMVDVTLWGSFASVARDAASEQYPAAVEPHVQAIRDNATILDLLVNQWIDQEIDSSQVPSLLAELDIGADIVALGETLRSAGFTDADLSQMMDELGRRMAEDTP